jgi:hypothetical protein
MAVENFIIPLTGLLAASDLRSNQYYMMGLNSSGTVTPCLSGDPGYIGVLLNKPNTGEPCEIAAPGSICPVSADAAVSVGWLLICSGDGEVVTAADGGYTVGLALEAATAAHQIIRCITWFPNSIADVSAFSTITI